MAHGHIKSLSCGGPNPEHQANLHTFSISQGESRASFPLCPNIVGFHVFPQPVWVNARESRLAEVDRPLDLEIASPAERNQIPWQEIPLVTVQMVNRE